MNIVSKTLLGATCALALALPCQAADTLMMATTTSTQDSGLLEFLEPTFRQETGIELKWVAVGTGKALEIAKNCDADVLLVHAQDHLMCAMLAQELVAELIELHRNKQDK